MIIRNAKWASICIRFSLIGIAAFHISLTNSWASSPNNSLTISTDTEYNSSNETSWLNKIDTHWGGRFKIIGSVSNANNDTIFAPVETGTFYDGSADFRLINETFFSEWGYFETHYEAIIAGGDTRRNREKLRSFFPNFPEQPLFLGAPLNDDTRLMDLSWTIHKDDKKIIFHRFDRLFFELLPDWGSIRIGRQAITWGNGMIFNPMDLFNPFPPTEIDRDYKVGDDMVNAQIVYPNFGDLQLLYVIRRDPNDDEVKKNTTSLAAKFHFSTGTTELDVMGSKHYDDWVVGVGSTGYLGDAAWRLDATWTFQDDPSDESPNSYLSLVANMDYSWIWWSKNFYGFIEYFFNGLGENDYPQALLNRDITERLQRGELFVLGKNYLSGTLQVELHPLFNVFFTVINNTKDPCGILQPRATWDITQNLQMTVGANIFYGDNGSEFGGFIIPGTDIRSRTPDNAYLWFNYYF